MNILLKSAKIVSPENKSLHLKNRDIFISGGRIEKIAAKINPPKATKQVVLDNLHVSVGWFDTGVAFGEPGFEERETISHGLEVAAKSGFTDIVLNPNTNPTPDTSSDIIFLREKAKGHATNLFPIGNLTRSGKGEDLAELYDMKNAGAIGFYDFKTPITNANLLKIALLYAQNFDGLVFSYPQDLKIKGNGNVNESEVSTRLGLKGSPKLAEELQLSRDLFILEYTGGKLHVPTISTAKSVKLIAEAKKKGLDVTCSVAIHNLMFSNEVLEEFNTNYKVLPPLREKVDQKALLKGLKEGHIDFVTTDHTPIDVEQKRVEFDNAEFGTIGLESAFACLNQIFGLEDCIAMLTRGRHRFGFSVPKIEEGQNACLALFNPNGEHVFSESDVLSTSKNSLFIGSKLKGKVYGTLNNGMLVC